ncbi:MAG: Uma2 family endonuclease [Ruminococcus sp.]|nr:Uma2 family endonuclease [Ruminococcus sp.]
MALPEPIRCTEEEYYALTGEERCELINGYIVDMSPPPSQEHQWIQDEIRGAIMAFVRSHNGKCRAYTNSEVRLADGYNVAPDVYTTCHPENSDGQRHLGGPDWVIEVVSPSNFTHDYYTKYNLYKEYGVREYWIIDPRKGHRTVTVYIWENGQETKTEYTFDDKIPVHIFRDKTPPLEICIGNYL